MKQMAVSIDIPRTSETLKGHKIRVRRALGRPGALPWEHRVASIDEVEVSAGAPEEVFGEDGKITTWQKMTKTLRIRLDIDYAGKPPKTHAILGYLSVALSQTNIRVTP